MKTLISLFFVGCVLFTACNTRKGTYEKPNTDIQPLILSNSDSLIGRDYRIDAVHSYIGFKIRYFGFSPVRGRFDNFEGYVFYDDKNLSSLSVTLRIDASSINTGNERRDNDLTSEGTWFDVDRYPNIFFQSKRVIVKEDNSFDLIGYLTMKGITRKDTFHFSKPTPVTRDWAGNDQVDFSGTATVNRQDYEIYGGDFWSSAMENGLTQLSDDVAIEMDIHTRRPNYDIRYQEANAADWDKIILDKINNNSVESGLTLIDSLIESEEISTGTISTIGYTLNAWDQPDKALPVFKHRLSLFPEISSTYNQLGITYLHFGDVNAAKRQFEIRLAIDSLDTRATEYLRMIDRYY